MQMKIIAALVIIIIVAAAGVGVWQFTQPASESPSPTPTASPTASTNPSESPSATASSEARPIRIGLVACYDKAEGQDMDRAAKMAVEEINAAGGVYVAEWNTNVQIELVIADTEDDTAAKAVGPVTRAIEEDNVDLLIGGYASAGTLADQVPAIENRVPFIITGASSNLVTRRGPQGNYGGLPEDNVLRIADAEGMSYMFHYCTTTADYSKTVVEFFTETMKPMLDSENGFDSSRHLRLAVLYRNDAFGQGVLGDTKKIIADENLPIDLVVERAYATDATSFQTDLIVVKDENPDAVYVVDFIANTAEIIKEGRNDVGLNTVYIAVECCEDPQYYTLLGQAGDKVLLESKFGPYAGPPFYLDSIETYVTDYQAKYNTLPGMMGADTYDAFYIAKNAIEAAGTVDKAAVRDAIENLDMDQMLVMTETGKIEFSTGTDYHEIAPVTFIEQFIWDESIGEVRPKIVYPETVPGVGTLKQADFVFPDGYQPGSP